MGGELPTGTAAQRPRRQPSALAPRSDRSVPAASNRTDSKNAVVARIARRHGATPAQIARAWLLVRSSVMLPMPGTANVRHLEENIGATAITLSPDDIQALE